MLSTEALNCTNKTTKKCKSAYEFENKDFPSNRTSLEVVVGPCKRK